MGYVQERLPLRSAMGMSRSKMILVEDLKEVVHAYDILEQLVVEYPPDEVWVIEVPQVIETPQIDQVQVRQKSQDWVWYIEVNHHP